MGGGRERFNELLKFRDFSKQTDLLLSSKHKPHRYSGLVQLAAPVSVRKAPPQKKEDLTGHQTVFFEGIWTSHSASASKT